jgi:hypothetical protein
LGEVDEATMPIPSDIIVAWDLPVLLAVDVTVDD